MKDVNLYNGNLTPKKDFYISSISKMEIIMPSTKLTSAK